ncbi:FBD-associated F-box protein [Trifolium repens]|nr:FBD-associated F-box protein [Trifolium repens]
MLSTQLIKTFHLECCSKHWKQGNHFIYSWFETAKQHPMEIIEISTKLTTSMLISLPLNIFCFRTLVVLKLNRLKVAGIGNISVDLPSLKTLHLIRVYLKNRDNFHQLLNGCPILEDLISDISYFRSNSGSMTELKTLPKLIRADIRECDVPFTIIYNIEVLKLKMLGRLSKLETSSYFRGILVCQNLIDLELSFDVFHHWDNVVEVLQSCPKLQILSFNKLSYSNNQSLPRNWKDPNYIPKCISSHLKSYFKNKQNFINLLYGCPILEDLLAQISFIEETEGVTVRSGEFKSLLNMITADVNAFDVPLRAISNVKILKLRMTKRLLEIDPYYGGFPVFQNLIELNISFYKFHHWNDLVGVLQYCPKLQILSIFKLAVKKHLSINWRYPNSVPGCISSHLRSCSINYEGWKDELRFTKYILQNAHFLEVMKIKISHSLKPNLHPLEELSSVPMISPQCKLSIG